MAVVTANSASFGTVEHEYIKRTHFDVQIHTIRRATGCDLRYHSHTMSDVVWSTAVQNGPETLVIVNAINSIKRDPVETKDYDYVLIKAIYAERGKRNAVGDLHYFSKNSKKVQAGVADRFVSEENRAQEMLKNENDY